jgi:hypothetical protein
VASPDYNKLFGVADDGYDEYPTYGRGRGHGRRSFVVVPQAPAQQYHSDAGSGMYSEDEGEGEECSIM